MPIYNGGNGKDTITGSSGDDIIYGGNGTDTLFGAGGNDSIYGGNGNDEITGGAGDDLIDGNNGFDIAYYSGLIEEYTFVASAGYLHVLHMGGAGADGHDRLINVERLVFADRVINIGSGTNKPIAVDDHVFINEETGLYNSGAAGVLANDFDFDGDALTVTGGTFTGTYGTLVLNSNGTYTYTPFAAVQALAEGQVVTDSFNYIVTDNDGSDTGALVFHIAGVNDAPVANPDSDTGDENAALLVDVLANDEDVDNGAVLTVIAVSVPLGQGSVSVVDNQVQFDPGTDFDDLAVGESEEVIVGYTIEDEHGAQSSSTVTITVTGSNDGPMANADTGATNENAVLLVDVLANDTDPDNGATLTVVAASVPPGQGSVTIVGDQVRFDPGTDFDYLNDGESAEVVIDYTIEDEHGAQSVSTLTIIVQGIDEGLTIVGTDDPDTLSGAGGDDNITALAGDDVANGGGGNDEIDGGDGNDFLSGDAGDDVITGGNDDDFISGGEGDDQLSGQAGNDSIFGDAGNDQLSGGTGSDGLNGGDGDDMLDGGDSDDSLSDLAGTNSFSGGLGNDNITAGSADGAQTIDGGDGDDNIVHYYRNFASTITTGAGRDTIELAHADQGSAALVVTDFTAGAGGDMVRLNGADGALLGLLTGWDGSSNPFGSGFLRLVQSGTDTLLQWDQNGTTGGATWDTLIVFQNSDADDFTDANFAPGYHPDGSTPGGATITGTADADTLNGTIGDDVINALAGDDTVHGGGGADQIDGGDGADLLSGEAGADVMNGGNDDDFLFGGDGNDQLSGQSGIDILLGESGNDTLAGGDGDDSLSGGDGDDSLDGGAGNDFLSSGAGSDVVNGGLGNDEITAGSADGPQTIDGGGDNDTIVHYYRYFASTITTGTGIDTVELAHADQGSAAVTVTDFTAGAGGDIFRLSGVDGSLLGLLQGWDGSSNPFGSSGFLRLLQSGADTLLQWDQNGTAGGASWQTLVVFENTDANDFTDANFTPGYNPDGSAPAGATINGTAGPDTLTGTIGDDTINALGGDDNVDGGAGADQIDGGDGNDFLDGGADNDIILGGNADDFLAGSGGNDQLSGQAGIDILVGDTGDDQLAGGTEDDSLNGGDGDDSLDGGDGADQLSDLAGTNSFTAGLGQDQITAGSTDGAQTIDAGDDDDTIVHYYRHFASTITTGSGIDTIELAYADQGSAALTVTDFTAGAGGDMIRLNGADGALLGLLEGWDGSSNPFGSGFLRLQQSGADTLLQWDQDGATGGTNWETLMVFENTDADDFTDANFVPGYHPDGSTPGGATITGTEDDDTLSGTIGDDVINALGGNDFVTGGGGADQMNGGDGNDFLNGQAGADVIDGGNENDFILGGDGNDQLSGGAGDDSLFAQSGNDELSGGDGSDTLNGGEGDNLLDGGAGADVMVGGDGADIFAFQSASDGPDEITDFASGTDQIQVSASGFGGGLTAGGSVSLVSSSNPTASGAGGQFLFDTDDGTLYWDADGSGAGTAVLIATLSNVPPLAASDFVVI